MRVVVIGSGNVAEALAVAIGVSSLDLVQVYGRNRERVMAINAVAGLANSGCYDELAAADLYIIAVSDSAITELSESLPFADGSIVVHTAASVDIDGLNTRKGIKKGVLYPLQTFTKGRRVNFRELPIFVEAQDEPTYLTLEGVARELSERVMPLSSVRRRELHVAAVFTCNFTMAMLTATHDILERCDLPLDLYEPLMRESIAKAFSGGIDPRCGMTGPAVRGDEGTMAQHIELLKSEPKLKESELLIDVYKIISKYIWETSKRI